MFLMITRFAVIPACEPAGGARPNAGLMRVVWSRVALRVCDRAFGDMAVPS